MAMSKMKIAGYYRLSVEDDNIREESNSITNQRLLIKQYIKQHSDLQKYEFLEFYDDGISGTTMNRPELQKMLELVKQDEIQCVIVKDLSRFSRDYIELGSYMEQIFPFMGVRFISIMDNYDSNDFIGKTASIDIEFKGLLADFYTKDVSEKVKSSLTAKREQGKYSTGNVSFGYEKNLKNRMELLIVPEEAEVVKKIFELSHMGMNLTEICKELNDNKIMTPLEFRNLRKKQNRKELQRKQRLWQPGTVRSILTSESYLGHMVYGKSVQAAVGSSKKKLKPRSERRIYKNHHIPIVSQELFDAVQEKFFKVNSSTRNSISYPLKGKVYCGNCHRKLRMMQLAQNKKSFYCAYHRLDSHNECLGGKIANEELEQIVLGELKQQLKQSVDFESTLKETESLHRKKIESGKKELNITHEMVNDLKISKSKLLEAYHEGKLTKEQYLTEKRKFDQELNVHSEKRNVQEQEIEIQADRMKQDKRNYEEYFRYAGFTELTHEMVEHFVEAVYVSADHSIDIHWTFNQQC